MMKMSPTKKTNHLGELGMITIFITTLEAWCTDSCISGVPWPGLHPLAIRDPSGNIRSNLGPIPAGQAEGPLWVQGAGEADSGPTVLQQQPNPGLICEESGSILYSRSVCPLVVIARHSYWANGWMVA
uniref:Uncharacterized protein n=1 Tax=Myotis myotis TaxID=51298 RepID=A0A7J7ZXJ6_MYOMY|nr:hypothetical protein mMyoMyo1_009892 [Myotis myotis]